jgi:LuxR family maltose regulon positive regulatory protein
VYLDVKGLVSVVDEEDLSFSHSELSQFLSHQDLQLGLSGVDEIMKDTKGWAFAISLIMRYLRKSPHYVGYVQRAMKQNIFRLMEREVWDEASGELRNLLVRMSLVGHLAAELVAEIAGHDELLLAELNKHNAYVRYDGYIDAYLVHHLFLEFLREKGEQLGKEELYETYAKAADWCVKNDFRADAMGYYAKIQNYEAIVSILELFSEQIPEDIAQFALDIFEKAPSDTFLKVDIFAYTHLRILLNLGMWDEIKTTSDHYENQLLLLPDDTFSNRALGCQYAILAQARMLLNISDRRYDFDMFYAKMDMYLSRSPIDPKRITNFFVGPWVNMVGAASDGALQEFRSALGRSVMHVSHCLDNRMAGLEELSLGEQKFYQSDLQKAKLHMLSTLDQAQDAGQFEIMHRAFFYLIRIAVSLGNLSKAEQTLHEMEDQIFADAGESYLNFFHIIEGWYYYYLRQPEKVPDWLKEKFTPYKHPSFFENYGNQIKAYYCYMTKNYPPLLIYISDFKKRGSVVFSRIQMLALEACTYYQMKDKKMAYTALKEAYDDAAPYDILMPFIELGKDMRTLTASAIREFSGIPKAWLEEICRRSATYAKRQSLAISEYRRVTNTDGERALSSLEQRVLVDLVSGLSRSDISTEQKLSINTINSVVSSIYDKLNANSVVEVVRVAIDRKLI